MGTSSNTEKMDEGTSARWMGADRAGSASKIGAVAQFEVWEEKPILRHQGRSSVFPTSSTQSPTRASCRGGKRGGLEGSWRREQHSREATCRGVEGRQREVTSSPSDREVGSLPELPRTSSKASRKSRRINCQSHGAKVSLRVGSARGRRTSAGSDLVPPSMTGNCV